MKQKVRKQGKRILGMALAAMFLFLQPVAEVHAAAVSEVEDDVEELEITVYELSEEELAGMPSTHTMLTHCCIDIGCEARGLVVDISTWATQTASVLGVKDIELQQKMWYGWKTIATSDGAESYNHSSMGLSFIYSNAVYGETYRVSCVHYGTVDTYTEVDHVSVGVVYKY